MTFSKKESSIKSKKVNYKSSTSYIFYLRYNKQQDMARLFNIISLITYGSLDLDTLRTDAAETKLMMALDLYKRKFM